MGTYDRQIATAKRLIESYGQKVIWRSISNGAPVDVDKPWRPSEAEIIEHEVTICFFSNKKENKQYHHYKKDTEVPTTSFKGLMETVEFKPNLKDEILRNGEVFKIKAIDPLNVNGEIVLYNLWLGND